MRNLSAIRSVGLVVAGLSMLAGCGVEELQGALPESGPESGDIASLAQGLVIAEGSREALGVLRVANETSATSLVSEVKLTTSQAAAIVAYRAGADNVPGNADDRTFKKLAELNAVPGIGDASITKMLTYAKNKGFVSNDPFDPESCVGAPMTASEAASRIGTSAYANLGAYKIVKHRRWCDRFMNCGAWDTSSSLVGPSGQAQIVARDGTYKLLLNDYVCSSRVPYYNNKMYGAECSAVTGPSTFCSGYHEFLNITWDANGEQVCSGTFVKLGDKLMTLGGTVTNRCMRLTGSASSISVGGGFEYRVGLLVRY